MTRLASEFFEQLPPVDPPWSTPDPITQAEPTQRGWLARCGSSLISLAVLAPNLLHIRVVPNGIWRPQRSWAVTPADEQWPIPDFTLGQTEETLELHTEQLQVELQRDPPRIRCRDAQGIPFAQDTYLGMGWRRDTIAAWKRLEAEEHCYGLGQRTGALNKRTSICTNWTTDAWQHTYLADALYQAIPFALFLRPGLAYGILLNTTHWSQFDLGSELEDVWHMETRAPELDYYVILGPDPPQILATYTQLTGRMPLPPRWALGYHQSRWSYNSEDKIRQVAQEFRERQIPCDVIHFDIDYMQGFRVFTWDPLRFPQPQQLIQELKDQGFKTVTIIDPGVKVEPESDYKVFEQGLEQDYFIRDGDGQLLHGYVWPGRSVFPDFLRPGVRQWWGDLHQDLVELGVAGIWNDMNEPAVHSRPMVDGGGLMDFPWDTPQGAPEEPTDHGEVHNLYGLMMARACAEGLQRLRPDHRSFVLTRSGFAGVQQWSAVWMGDNQSLWEQLEMSLPMLCNMGLSGIGFVGSDIGGFEGNATPELFARWMQVGLLYPLMRGHSAMSTRPHEPWVFGPEVEEICRSYIGLRYQLLPYLYTLFWQATETGAPILRPLLYHFPQDPHTYALADQVMLGPTLMAAPILRSGMTHRGVYLPAGSWFDWWTGQQLTGSTHVLAEAPLDRMPLYVRAGGVIPMAPIRPSISSPQTDPLRLRIWPGEGNWLHYEDDGETFEYQQGNWSTLSIQVRETGAELQVTIAPRQGAWVPPQRDLIIDVVGRGEQRVPDDGSAQDLQFPSP